jgi:hypothetical protein
MENKCVTSQIISMPFPLTKRLCSTNLWCSGGRWPPPGFATLAISE